MIKGFYGGSYEMPIPFSNWNNFDKILDLIDDYIELKESVRYKNLKLLKMRSSYLIEQRKVG